MNEVVGMLGFIGGGGTGNRCEGALGCDVFGLDSFDYGVGLAGVDVVEDGCVGGGKVGLNFAFDFGHDLWGGG